MSGMDALIILVLGVLAAIVATWLRRRKGPFR